MQGKKNRKYSQKIIILPNMQLEEKAFENQETARDIRNQPDSSFL